MDRGNIAPAPVSLTTYELNALTDSMTNGSLYLLNTYNTFGKKKPCIASNAFELTSHEYQNQGQTQGQDMYMLLPPEMRNNVQPVLSDINENR